MTGLNSRSRNIIAQFEDDLIAWAYSGFTVSDIAREMHQRGETISWNTTDKILRSFGIVVPGGVRSSPSRRKGAAERAEAMAALYRGGYTLESIGAQYGVTRERVRQIVHSYYKLSMKDGGLHVAAAKRREMARSTRNSRCIQKHGCSLTQYRELQRIGAAMQAAGYGPMQTPIGAFRTQQHNADARGVEWKLKLWEWWQIWQDSGRWEQRGRGSGYVMARHGDEGPYAVGNVFICHATENNSNTKAKKSGLPTGVQLVVRGKYRAYVATRMLRGKMHHLGSYKTPELAHAAYLAAGSSVAA